MTLLDTDAAVAEARFREATETDPSMADAWLGRIAAGDESLSTVQQLYTVWRLAAPGDQPAGRTLVGADQSRALSIDFGDRGLPCRSGTG